MINAIINGIFTVVQSLISIVLAPIDILLSSIPNVAEATAGITNFITIAKNAMAWAWDIIPANTKIALQALFVVIAFTWSATFSVKMIKMAYNWIQKIKFW